MDLTIAWHISHAVTTMSIHFYKMNAFGENKKQPVSHGKYFEDVIYIMQALINAIEAHQLEMIKKSVFSLMSPTSPKSKMSMNLKPSYA